MTVTVETGPGVWWTFNLKRVSNSPIKGNWKLDGDGAAGVGPSAGSTEWWGSVEADRPCWYDDIMHFGADGTFLNAMGGETWVEAWQGGLSWQRQLRLTMAVVRAVSVMMPTLAR